MTRKPKRENREREWLVPVRLEFSGSEVVVRAASCEDAIAKVNSGEWTSIVAEGECINWRATGPAKENI